MLRRPHLDRYLHENERIDFLVTLVRESVVIDVPEVVQGCSDPKDDKYLTLAIAGKAECIVSGDSHLLEMSPFREMPILTPRAFLSAGR